MCIIGGGVVGSLWFDTVRSTRASEEAQNVLDVGRMAVSVHAELLPSVGSQWGLHLRCVLPAVESCVLLTLLGGGVVLRALDCVAQREVMARAYRWCVHVRFPMEGEGDKCMHVG